MINPRFRLRSRTAVALLTALGALLLAVSPALADKELSHSGKVGQRSLNDSFENRGAYCNYAPYPNANLVGFTVIHPNVYARNKTSGTDTGKVGWRFLVKRKRDTQATWYTFWKSPVWKTTTTDSTPADFSDQTVTVPNIPDDGNHSYYQIVVKLFWYSAGGSKIGVATRKVEWYWEAITGSGNYETSSCFQTAI